jgi:hypothetical protein
MRKPTKREQELANKIDEYINIISKIFHGQPTMVVQITLSRMVYFYLLGVKDDSRLSFEKRNELTDIFKKSISRAFTDAENWNKGEN